MDKRFIELNEYKGVSHDEYYWEKLYQVKDKPLIVLSCVYWFDYEWQMNPANNLNYIKDEDIDSMIVNGVKAYKVSQCSGTTPDFTEVYDDIEAGNLRKYISDVEKKYKTMTYKDTYIKDGILYNAASGLLEFYGSYEKAKGWVKYNNADGSCNNPKNSGHYAVIYALNGDLCISRMAYLESDKTTKIKYYWRNCKHNKPFEGVKTILYWMPLPPEMF